MGKLTFPWNTARGVMVGYGADPEIDTYFLTAVTEMTQQWQEDAGIHPRAKLGGCSGEVLTAVIHVLLSFYTKHIVFVEEGIRLHPAINQYMSLTIWKPRSELVNSLVLATGASEREVSAALDLITVCNADADYYLTEQAPGAPLVIELCDGYVLTPISGVFRNPFNGVRMLREMTSIKFKDAFRLHREEWMAEDLYALFEGTRFECVKGQIKLRRDGKVITDIDAAIYDSVTGDLVLFQLKWQDFSSSSVRTQKSKAKNFTDRVQTWAQRTLAWIEQFGVPALCQSLKITVADRSAPRVVRLIAIGRSNARFRSYGYDLGHEVIALPWPQFVRLRYTIGPDREFFELLTRAVLAEKAAAIKRTPLPCVLERHGLRIIFTDIWSAFDDEEDDRDTAEV